MDRQGWFIVPLAMAAVLWESWQYRRQRRPYPWADAAVSLGVYVGDRVATLAFGLALGPIYLWVWHHRLTDLPVHGVARIALLFFVVEFAYYWQHRLSHESRWLWASHSVHHSCETLTFSSAYRLGWTGFVSLLWLFYLPPLACGFSPREVGAMLGLNLLYQFWLHTELIPKLGWIEEVFNTPSHHRVHHASNPRYLDRNYGGVLIVFDRLFGTFERESERCRYGLVHPIPSRNPIVLALHEWSALARDLRRARGVRQAIGFLFRAPGWSPAPISEISNHRRTSRRAGK